MYSLLVSHQFKDWDGGTFRFDKSRFLEYTSEVIKEQLRTLSIEAISCLSSWPCVLMDEGRAEELIRIGRISDLRDLGREIRLTVKLCPSRAPILNGDVWRIRDDLDIEQFEFSRNHWAVKERDLLSVLRSAGHDIDTSAVGPLQEMPLPAPTRAALVRARNAISEWSHTGIDDLLLEAGVADLSGGRDAGSRRERANAIVEFAIQNPSSVTAENSLLSAYLVRRASAAELEVRGEPHFLPPKRYRSAEALLLRPRPPIARRIAYSWCTARTKPPAQRLCLSREHRVTWNRSSRAAEHGSPSSHELIQEAELVTFAVVLMTDDDVGSLKAGRLAPRARQNVILELGYFLAHLGQAKVCALITPGLETPSDFDGIVYIRMDADQRWQQELRRELWQQECRSPRVRVTRPPGNMPLELTAAGFRRAQRCARHGS